MAITRKPKAQESNINVVDVDALINKGGSVASTTKLEPDTAPIAITLRVPAPLVAKIDTAITSRPIKTPRHTWLLEAVLEKLNREAE
jgi:hypothetical protein